MDERRLEDFIGTLRRGVSSFLERGRGARGEWRGGRGVRGKGEGEGGMYVCMYVSRTNDSVGKGMTMIRAHILY